MTAVRWHDHLIGSVLGLPAPVTDGLLLRLVSAPRRVSSRSRAARDAVRPPDRRGSFAGPGAGRRRRPRRRTGRCLHNKSGTLSQAKDSGQPLSRDMTPGSPSGDGTGGRLHRQDLDVNDIQLVQRMRSGDERAFDEFFGVLPAPARFAVRRFCEDAVPKTSSRRRSSSPCGRLGTRRAKRRSLPGFARSAAAELSAYWAARV